MPGRGRFGLGDVQETPGACRQPARASSLDSVVGWRDDIGGAAGRRAQAGEDVRDAGPFNGLERRTFKNQSAAKKESNRLLCPQHGHNASRAGCVDNRAA